MKPSQQGWRWHEQYPDLGHDPVPVEPCISPEYFEREREGLFNRVWLYAGREQDVAEPRQFFVWELEVCRASVLIVRGTDGVLRAFHNMCRHRGNKLVREERGTFRGFTCGFHGWTYQSDGRLSGVPAEDRFLDFDKCDYGLTPVSVDTWSGLIFVNLDPHPEQTLHEYLGEANTSLEGYPFAAFTEHFSYAVDFNANWKVILGAFQEAYHVAFVHKNSLASATSSKSNPYSAALLLKVLQPYHGLFSGAANMDYTPTPVELAAFKGGMSFAEQIAGFGGAQGRTTGLNPTGSSNWSIDLLYVFPNLVFGLLDGMYFLHEFWPIATGRVLWKFGMYLPKARSASQRFSQEHVKVELRDTIREDSATVEPTHRSLESGRLDHFVLQDEELLIRHTFRVIEELLQEQTSTEPMVTSGREARRALT